MAIIIKTGNANTQDAIENGRFPLFDRSKNIKKSNIFIFDGEYTIVPGEGIFIPKYFNGKFNLHQRAYALTSMKENNKYIYYFILKFFKKFYNYSVGSTVPSLRISSFSWVLNHQYPLRLYQDKIIDIIEPLEKLIVIIDSIYNNILLLKQYIYSYSIYKKEKLGEVASSSSGKQPPLNMHINIYKKGYERFIQNRDYGDYKIKSYISKSFNGTLVNKNDIVIDKYGIPGKMRYGIDGFINVAMMKIIPNNIRKKESIRNFFENKNILKWLKSSSQASTRPSLNWSFLKSIDIGISNQNNILSNLLTLEMKIQDIKQKKLLKIKINIINLLIK